jgi:hypothetical protein
MRGPPILAEALASAGPSSRGAALGSHGVEKRDEHDSDE